MVLIIAKQPLLFFQLLVVLRNLCELVCVSKTAWKDFSMIKYYDNPVEYGFCDALNIWGYYD